MGCSGGDPNYDTGGVAYYAKRGTWGTLHADGSQDYAVKCGGTWYTGVASATDVSNVANAPTCTNPDRIWLSAAELATHGCSTSSDPKWPAQAGSGETGGVSHRFLGMKAKVVSVRLMVMLEDDLERGVFILDPEAVSDLAGASELAREAMGLVGRSGQLWVAESYLDEGSDSSDDLKARAGEFPTVTDREGLPVYTPAPGCDG